MEPAAQAPPLVLELTDGSRWPCFPGAVIGRAGDVAPERLSLETKLSRRHLRIEQAGANWQVVRFPEARNRTWLDGQELEPDRGVTLQGTHVLQVAHLQLRLIVLGSGATTASPTSYAGNQTEAGLRDILRECPSLILVLDDGLHCRWSTRQAEAILGKQPGDFLQLAPPEEASAWRETLHQLRGSAEEQLISLTVAGRKLSLRFRYRYPYYLGLPAEEAASPDRDAVARQMRTLSLLAQSPAFQEGDIAKAFALLTSHCGEATGARVTVWLADRPEMLVCHGSEGRIRLNYCPDYFQRLQHGPAEEQTGTPAFFLLQEIGFVGAASCSVLTVALQTGGVLSFERETSMPWAEHERHFAHCAASYCLLALQASSRDRAMASLRETETLLRDGLETARHYVERILPPPLRHPDVRAEWSFQPSEAVGGDSLGYHWIDPDHLAMYVIDVVGHGTAAALLSVSVINAMRSQLLPIEDFRDPSAVLSAVNGAFQMEEQGMMTFTMWYGVFDRVQRRIAYASAGHPPALLLWPAESNYRALGTDGLIIGGLENAAYDHATVELGPQDAKLYVFSDGAFEIPLGEDRIWTFEEFTAAVRFTQSMASGEPAYLLERARALCATTQLPDDFAMVRFHFPPPTSA